MHSLTIKLFLAILIAAVAAIMIFYAVGKDDEFNPSPVIALDFEESATGTEAKTIAPTSTSSEIASPVDQIKASPTPKTVPPPAANKPTPKTPLPQSVKQPKSDVSELAALNSVSMLSLHNNSRQAKGLAKLTWSSELTQSAQDWSRTLQTENCKMRHDPKTGYGENIFWQNLTGSDTESMISSESDAVGFWVAEEKFYTYKDNTCRAGEQCGHYTQIVWADTTEVGCGVSSCISDDSRTDIWVCRYNPPGNNGEKPY